MARELPINNGRLTTDLDADGHKIINLSGGTEGVSWDNVTGKPTFATVATSGQYSDLAGKPTIPTKTSDLTNDSGFLTQHQDVSGKLDGAAAYPAWVSGGVYVEGTIVSYKGGLWMAMSNMTSLDTDPPDESPDWDSGHTINDLKQDTLAQSNYATTQNPTPKQTLLRAMNPHVGAVIGGVGYMLPQSEKVADQLLLKANATDLPYALVTPGEWEFSDGQSHTVYGPTEGLSGWFYMLDDEQTGDYSNYFSTESEALAALSLTFLSTTATRASLPGHLCDRAVNAVSVSAATTLTLPATAGEDKSRNFYLKLSLSSGATVSFAAASGESEPTFIPASPSLTSGVWHFTEVSAGTYSITECGKDWAALIAQKANLTDLSYSVTTPPDPTLTTTTNANDTATYTLVNRARNDISIGASSEIAYVNINPPTAVTNKVRDCILTLDLSALSDAPSVSFDDTIFFPRTDAATDLAAEVGVNVYYITEYANGKFCVARWVEPSAGGGS